MASHAGVRDPRSAWTWTLLRPILMLRLRLFRKLVSEGIYPPPAPVGPAPCEADRVLFVGSTASARFGVTVEGLTTLSRVSVSVSAQRGKQFHWIQTGVSILSAREAAARIEEIAGDADAALVAIGFTDVLLMTRPTDWATNLMALIQEVQGRAGSSCGIVLAGIPPMADFRQSSRLGRVRIRNQVVRLNEATRIVADSCGACVFVPFPVLQPGVAEMRRHEYSWAAVHLVWSRALSDALIEVLDHTAPLTTNPERT
ncbi:OSK domain-containing protein [Frondihabitans sp. PhB161]|nr:OSK domain-containing protein [Frondihabitans sp. PhB153]RPF08110.1 OSK domain-containing protein [Frondihabitans sp. PhB161]